MRPSYGPAALLRGREKGGYQREIRRNDSAWPAGGSWAWAQAWGVTTKIPLISDARGVPLGLAIRAGERHEAPFFEAVMKTLCVPRRQGRLRDAAPSTGGPARATTPSASARGCAHVVAQPEHHGDHCGARGRDAAPGAAVRLLVADVEAAQGHRALHRLAQGRPPSGHAL